MDVDLNTREFPLERSQSARPLKSSAPKFAPFSLNPRETFCVIFFSSLHYRSYSLFADRGD